jgi:hypothetical protein
MLTTKRLLLICFLKQWNVIHITPYSSFWCYWKWSHTIHLGMALACRDIVQWRSCAARKCAKCRSGKIRTTWIHLGSFSDASLPFSYVNANGTGTKSRHLGDLRQPASTEFLVEYNLEGARIKHAALNKPNLNNRESAIEVIYSVPPCLQTAPPLSSRNSQPHRNWRRADQRGSVTHRRRWGSQVSTKQTWATEGSQTSWARASLVEA